jgi:hypothetical protein
MRALIALLLLPAIALCDQKQNPFPSAQDRLPKGWNLFLFGDLLFLSAKEDGLGYATQGVNLAEISPRQNLFGKVRRINPDSNWGYRAGFGYHFMHDSWDAIFTWFHTHDNGSSHAPFRAGQQVFPLWANLLFDPVAQSAMARWKLEFNQLDVELGKPFFIDQFLYFKPRFGARALWTDQHFQADYRDLTIQGGSLSFLRAKIHQEFQGYGPLLGLDTKWNLGIGFHLMANGTGSLLWSNFTFQHQEETPDPSGDGTSHATHLRDELFTTTAVIDLLGGVAWERKFFSDRLFLHIHAAWEQHFFFRHNQINRFLDSSVNGITLNEKGNLSLSGFNVGLQLGF